MLTLFLKTNAFITSSFAKVLVYANVFISLCAAAQVWTTYQLFSIPWTYDNSSFMIFVALSTYLQYNVQRGYFIQNINLYTESAIWITKHRKIILITSAISLLVVLYLCRHLSDTSIAVLVGAEIVSTCYYLPPFHLRKNGYLKPLVISSIWVISCSMVPLIENHLLTAHSAIFLVAQFAFISVLCILFDVKDTTDDYLNGIDTYSNTLGITGTKLLCGGLVIVTGICFYFFKPVFMAAVAEAILLFATLLVIYYTSEKKHRYYYYMVVDGLLLFQALIFYGVLYK